jgi:hypothetical protein
MLEAANLIKRKGLFSLIGSGDIIDFAFVREVYMAGEHVGANSYISN